MTRRERLARVPVRPVLQHLQPLAVERNHQGLRPLGESAKDPWHGALQAVSLEAERPVSQEPDAQDRRTGRQLTSAPPLRKSKEPSRRGDDPVASQELLGGQALREGETAILIPAYIHPHGCADTGVIVSPARFHMNTGHLEEAPGNPACG